MRNSRLKNGVMSSIQSIQYELDKHKDGVMEPIQSIQYELDKHKETCEKYENIIFNLERQNEELKRDLAVKNYDIDRCHYVYLLIHKETRHIYVGMRSADVDPYTDDYYGSGNNLDNDRTVYEKIILGVYATREQAHLCEAMIVNDNFISREDTINMRSPLPSRFTQCEGIKKAKAEGKFKGRQSSFSVETIEQLKAEFSHSSNKVELAKKYGISRSYLYKLLSKY